MRKVLLAPLYTLCLGLVVASAYLLATPVAKAATGTAKCPGGWAVVCPGNGTASDCDCLDNRGCTATFADGSTRQNNCDDWPPYLD